MNGNGVKQIDNSIFLVWEAAWLSLWAQRETRREGADYFCITSSFTFLSPETSIMLSTYPQNCTDALSCGTILQTTWIFLQVCWQPSLIVVGTGEGRLLAFEQDGEGLASPHVGISWSSTLVEETNPASTTTEPFSTHLMTFCTGKPSVLQPYSRAFPTSCLTHAMSCGNTTPIACRVLLSTPSPHGFHSSLCINNA